MNWSNYQKYYPVLRWLLAFVSVLVFVYQWQQIPEETLSDFYAGLAEHRWWWILMLTLMLLNWFLESLKFSILLKRPDIGFVRKFSSVFTGLTVSNFTPARTGEYLGRALLFKELPILRVVASTITGSLTQAMITYIFGILFAFYVSTNSGVFTAYPMAVSVGITMLLLLAGVLVLFKPAYRKFRHKLPEKWRDSLKIIREYSLKDISMASLLSTLRYLVFSLQFALLFYFLSDFEFAFRDSFYIPLIFLIQSVLAIPAIGDLGLRITAASMFYGDSMDSSVITLAILSLWLINLILPAALGSLILVGTNLSKN